MLKFLDSAFVSSALSPMPTHARIQTLFLPFPIADCRTLLDSVFCLMVELPIDVDGAQEASDLETINRLQ